MDDKIKELNKSKYQDKGNYKGKSDTYKGKKKPYHGNRDKKGDKAFKEGKSTLANQSVLAALFKSSPLITTAVSGTELAPGAFPGIEIAKRTIYVSATDTWMDATAWGMVSAQLTSILAAYGSARGFATTVTAANVYDYLLHSIRALATLCALKRIQDAVNVTDASGMDISALFETRTYRGGAINMATTLGELLNSTAITSVSDVTTISNAVWQQTYLSELHKIRLPKQIIMQVIAMFSGYFEVPTGAGVTLYEFMDTGLNGNVNAATVYTGTHIAALNALLANPDMYTVLDMLGFTAEPLLAMDWNRDIRGKTVNIIRDPEIVNFLANGWIETVPDVGVTGDTDVIYRLLDLSRSRSIFDNVAISNIDISNFMLPLMFGLRFQSAFTTSYIMNHISTIDETGTLAHSYCWAPCRLIFDATSTATTAELHAISDRLTYAMARWCSHTSAVSMGFFPAITAKLDDNAGSIDVISVSAVAIGISEPENSWYIPSDIEMLINSIKLEYIFGAQWRSRLQLLLQSVSSRSNSQM